MTYFNFISSAVNLHAKPFLRFNYQTVSKFATEILPEVLTSFSQIEGGTAHPGFICHKQPAMERCLREVISSEPDSELRSGSTLCAIEEDKEGVIVTYITSTGETAKLRAKFFVGADGKTGFTRKKYLEAKGITMEKDAK